MRWPALLPRNESFRPVPSCSCLQTCAWTCGRMSPGLHHAWQPLKRSLAVCRQPFPCLPPSQAFSAIYARLGVTLQERGESFYNPRLRGVVEELQEMAVAEESEGAIVVWAKVGCRAIRSSQCAQMGWLPCDGTPCAGRQILLNVFLPPGCGASTYLLLLQQCELSRLSSCG